jgi:hypothetical protein
MIALWYRNDVLEPASFQDGRQHIRRTDDRPLPLHAALGPVLRAQPYWNEVGHLLARDEVPRLDAWVRWTRRQRRSLARFGRGPGRRLAVPVGSGRWVPQAPLPRIEVLLYLPERFSVTDEHIRDVTRWLRREGHA